MDLTTWAKKGNTIEGKGGFDGLGYFSTCKCVFRNVFVYFSSTFLIIPSCLAVALSDADGSIIAIGAFGYDGANKTDVGEVTIYVYNDRTRTWELRGEPINGNTPNVKLGFSVSLSSNGHVVGIGAPELDLCK